MYAESYPAMGVSILSDLWAGRPRLFPAVLILLLLAGIACGNVSSTETPVPFFSPTPKPTATATPLPTATTEPTLVPTPPPPLVAEPITIAALTRQHLPSIVLTMDQVQAEFPSLPFDPDGTGYQDNEAAADNSLDPDDTGPDLAARGRLDGYQTTFFDSVGIFGGSSSGDQPIVAELSVHLFSNSGAAQAFIRQSVQNFRRLQGQEIGDGVTLGQFAPFTASPVGTDTLAGRYDFFVDDLGLEFFGTFIAWRRDNLAFSVDIGATDDRDWAAPTQRLAMLMDQRLNGVLAGTVRAAPISPISTPAPAAVNSRSGQTGEIPGAALPAMLPTLEDLAPGAVIEGDGFVQDTDALSAYEREFAAEGLTFNLGSSQIVNLDTTVELYATALEASGPVLLMQAMDPQLFALLAGPGFAEGFGSTPEDLVVEAIDLPAIGDATAGFLMRLQTPLIDLDSYMLWFAQGRIAAQVIVVGLPGQIHLDDVTRIALIIDQRIRENAP